MVKLKTYEDRLLAVARANKDLERANVAQRDLAGGVAAAWAVNPPPLVGNEVYLREYLNGVNQPSPTNPDRAPHVSFTNPPVHQFHQHRVG